MSVHTTCWKLYDWIPCTLFGMAFIGYSSCTIDLHSHYRVFYWLNNNEKTFVWSKLKEFLVENHQKENFKNTCIIHRNKNWRWNNWRSTWKVISKIMYKKSFKYLKPNKLQHQCELKASTGFLLLLHKPFCVQSDPVMYTLMQQILIHYLF